MVVKTLSETGTHKPKVTGSSPVAATNTSRKPRKEQGLVYNPQAHPHINPEQGISLKQAVDGFILSCKVEGKSQGTIDCYSSKYGVAPDSTLATR